ncbi:MAG TPA: hypothetical protein VJT83_03095 [Chitinophagaceae bacterium]|nr:hypothetical protein [Chitinophagaceae bacterium]
MQRTNSLLLCLLLAGFAFLFSCQKSIEKSNSVQIPEIAGQIVVPPTCGNSTTVILEDLGGNPSGTMIVSNDGTNYYFMVSETVAGYDISAVKLLYGDENHVKTSLQGIIQCGLAEPQSYDKVVNYSPRVTEALVTVPIASIPGDCFWFHVHVTVASDFYAYQLWNQGERNASQNPCQDYSQYCKQTCPPPPPTDCGGLRTQTMGGWGADPNGHNPGTYLHTNFALAFPSGLRVGCEPGNSVLYTNAQAITNFLPAGGEAGVLTGDATNPADKSIKNVLLGQVTALALSVRFDAWDAGFGSGGQTLGSMYILTGTFAGKTVSEFLAIANNVLGGCSNAYSAKQVNEVASAINENYVDGKVNLGYLGCTAPTTR